MLNLGDVSSEASFKDTEKESFLPFIPPDENLLPQVPSKGDIGRWEQQMMLRDYKQMKADLKMLEESFRKDKEMLEYLISDNKQWIEDLMLFIYVLRFIQLILTIIPVVDIITDFISFGIYVWTGEVWWSFFCWSIIHWNFRFSMLYGFIHPQPKLKRILIMYVPILTIYQLGYVTKLDEEALTLDERNIQNMKTLHGHEMDKQIRDRMAYAQKNRDSYTYNRKKKLGPVKKDIELPPDKFVGKLYKKKSLQTRLLGILRLLQKNFDERHFMVKPFMAFFLEMVIFFVSFFIGPFFTIGASWKLAKMVVIRKPERKGFNRALLYSKVICFIEAIFESTPQIILQTYIYFRAENITLWVYAVSASCSALGVIKAAWTFYWNYEKFLSILMPAVENQTWNIHTEVNTNELTYGTNSDGRQWVRKYPAGRDVTSCLGNIAMNKGKYYWSWTVNNIHDEMWIGIINDTAAVEPIMSSAGGQLSYQYHSGNYGRLKDHGWFYYCGVVSHKEMFRLGSDANLKCNALIEGYGKGDRISIVLDCNLWIMDIWKNFVHQARTTIPEGTYYPVVVLDVEGDQLTLDFDDYNDDD